MNKRFLLIFNLLFTGLALTAQGNPYRDAIWKGDLAEVQALIKADPKLVNDLGDGLHQSPLSLAIQSGHVEIVQLLLENKVTISSNALATALYKIEIVKLLLAHGADVNQHAKSDGWGGHITFVDHKGQKHSGLSLTGWAPLMVAASCDQVEMIELLLAHGADVNIRDSRQHTPLYWATAQRHKEAAEILMKHGGEGAIDPQVYEFNQAFQRGDLIDVHAILQARPDLVDANLENGSPPLIQAVLGGPYKLADVLLANKANVNIKDRSGKSALYWAEYRGDDRIAKTLRNLGAAEDTGIDWAILKGDVERVKALIQQDPKLLSARDAGGMTELHWAVMVPAPWDSQRRTENQTVVSNQLAVVKLLIASGADVNAKANNGQTPLHLAGRLTIVELLLANHADVNAKDNWGNTPLHRANRVPVVELLLANNADINAKNDLGKTPLALAGHPCRMNYAVADVLRRHGAQE